MEPEELFCKFEDGIAKITLNRPEKRNALDAQMTKELISAIQEANQREEIKVIVLTGKGEVFCAGGDIKNFMRASEKGAPSLYKTGEESSELFKITSSLVKPLIASVNGAAVGGGCGLVAMSHLAIATEKSKLGVPEIKVGMFPFVIFPLLVSAIGPRKALELALTGELIDAWEAKRIGLLNYVVSEDSLTEETLRLASLICNHSPLVVRLGLDAYHKTQNMEVNKAFSYLNLLRVVDFLSEDLQEGAKAFIEKRAPSWQGK